MRDRPRLLRQRDRRARRRKHIGPITNVFHEIQSDVVRIDILVVGPHEGRPYTTLVTCGMSERPMRIPIEDPDDLARVPELRFAELLVCLPPDWPLTPEAFLQEENYWPVRWLKRLAACRISKTAGSASATRCRTATHRDRSRRNTQFCCWLIDEPVSFPQAGQKLRAIDRAINFYSIVPLYEGEMAHKIEEGSASLGRRLDQAKVSELIDLNRPSAVP